MATIKQLLFTNWHLMRWVRLIIGLAILIYAFQTRDITLGMLAAFLLFQAVMNVGCCGSTGCDLPNIKKTN